MVSPNTAPGISFHYEKANNEVKYDGTDSSDGPDVSKNPGQGHDPADARRYRYDSSILKGAD